MLHREAIHVKNHWSDKNCHFRLTISKIMAFYHANNMLNYKRNYHGMQPAICFVGKLKAMRKEVKNP
jgi:hypothetical protein